MILLLRQRGYQVTAAANMTDVANVADQPFSLLCLDMMTPGVEPNDPLVALRNGDFGSRLQKTPILLTDVNGLLTTTHPGAGTGADGVFAPRTGRGFPFLVEVERLAPPPPQLPTPIQSWRLDKNELPAFLYACFLFRVHGTLTLRDGRIFKQLHFVDGWIRSAASSLESDWLGKMLLARHQITPEALNEVERALANSKKRIGEEMVSRGLLSNDQLAKALNQQYASIVMSVFEWEWLEVSIDDGPANPEPQLGEHPFKLIIAGLSYGFTETEMDKVLGGDGVYPTPTAWTAFRLGDIDLNPDERHLLAMINGQFTIRDLVRRSQFAPEATKKIIVALATIRAIALSDQPRDFPITFDCQIGGDHQAALENAFFQESGDTNFADLGEFEIDDLADLAEQQPPWLQQFAGLDIKLGIRYILLVILGLIVLWVGIQKLVERDVDLRIAAVENERQAKKTEIVLIKKPIYERADRLMVEALLQLKGGQWDGVDEARSLIGAALAIDPKFDAARNLASSIAVAEEARVALVAGKKDRARLFIEKAVQLFPDNPLLPDLLAAVGMTPPAKQAP